LWGGIGFFSLGEEQQGAELQAEKSRQKTSHPSKVIALALILVAAIVGVLMTAVYKSTGIEFLHRRLLHHERRPFHPRNKVFDHACRL